MSDITLFTFIGDTVTNATDAFVTPAAANLMFKLQDGRAYGRHLVYRADRLRYCD